MTMMVLLICVTNWKRDLLIWNDDCERCCHWVGMRLWMFHENAIYTLQVAWLTNLIGVRYR